MVLQLKRRLVVVSLHAIRLPASRVKTVWLVVARPLHHLNLFLAQVFLILLFYLLYLKSIGDGFMSDGDRLLMWLEVPSP